MTAGPAVLPTAPARPADHRDVGPGGAPFSFVLISDRTGGARPGVFERGLAVTDLLAPSFAVQLGDLIEGYSHDPAVIEDEWRQIDAMVAQTATTIVHVPGNHDVSNPVQRDIWQRRFGPTYSHFRYGEVLFCLVDTQDPPPPYESGQSGPQTPRQARLELERSHDWDGTQPAHLSPAQLDYWRTVLDEHADARWTVVCMHMPLWQGRHPAWTRLRELLGDRPYTAFAGHVHNYRHDVIDGRSHVRLGPTGGMWVVGGPEGNFDHVTQVTMTPQGPVLATVLLDGIRDVDGQPLSPLATRTVAIY